MGVKTPRAAAEKRSVIVHTKTVLMIMFVKGGIRLSDKDASPLCGIYTELLIKVEGLGSL